MPLIKVECSNCGGILSLDRDKGEAVCPFCNTPYILESVHIENATIIRPPKDTDELVSDGVSFLRLKQYEDALDSFTELSRSCPKDWRGWYGKDIAKYFLHPEEGLMITAEEWELFPHKVRERKEELLSIAALGGGIRQEELRLEEAEDRAAYSAGLQQVGIREDLREADALRSHMDEKYKRLLVQSVVYGVTGVAGLLFIIAGWRLIGVILLLLAAIGAASLVVSKVWGHSFDGQELNMNVSEIQKKREKLLGEAGDRQRIAEGIGQGAERKRRETEGRIGVLKAQIDAELKKIGFATLEDLFLSELERGS